MVRAHDVDRAFTRALPKIELHAHLTVSVTREVLRDIWQRKKSDAPDITLDNPLESLPVGKVDFNVQTFFPLFDKYIYELCNDVESVKYSTERVLESFRDDGVRYLELHTTPREHKATDLTKDEYLSTVLKCIEDFGRAEMHTYLLLSIDRKNTADEADQVVT